MVELVVTDRAPGAVIKHLYPALVGLPVVIYQPYKEVSGWNSKDKLHVTFYFSVFKFQFMNQYDNCLSLKFCLQ